jgi:hypothetical protein
MPENDPGPHKTFRAEDYAQDLRVPEGLPYVDGEKLEQIRDALEAGLGVYVESCEGKAFVWPEGDGFTADHFYYADPRRHDFETAAGAADFASGLCE